ncbi:MAG: hypothetical protein BGO95_03790 [Micrococcales bacterium 73-13]|nr:MAG: hypothetical protein BGO95_03790 [Micrococcales bacterium 73-13]
MRASDSRARTLRLALAGGLGVGVLLLSPVAASASLGDASAVAVDADGVLTPLDPITNDPLFSFALDQTAGPVAAPPDAVYSLPGIALQADLGPFLGGLQDVLWFDGLASAASSTGTGSAASASVDEFRMNTAGGQLTIQGISSSVACSANGTTASVGSGMTVDLGGTPVPLDPSGITVIDFFDPPVPGFHFVITLVQSSSTTANSATANGLTIVIDEDLTGIIKANATIAVAQSSCTVNLAETGGAVPVFAVPSALALLGLGAAILAVAARARRRAADAE